MSAKRKFFTALVAVGLCLSLTSVAAASPSISGEDTKETLSFPDTKMSRVPISLDIQARTLSGNTVVITDQAELEKIAIEDGLEKVPVKVEYEYVPQVNQSNTVTPPLITPLETILSITSWDEGYGWYNATTDMYKDFLIDGPDKFVIKESTKKSSTWTGSFGFSKAPIEAKIGFTIGTERTMEWSSETPIAAGQSCYFQLYTTYHKVNYAINTDVKSYAGVAYDPTGTYVKKTFY